MAGLRIRNDHVKQGWQNCSDGDLRSTAYMTEKEGHTSTTHGKISDAGTAKQMNADNNF